MSDDFIHPISRSLRICAHNHCFPVPGSQDRYDIVVAGLPIFEHNVRMINVKCNGHPFAIYMGGYKLYQADQALPTETTPMFPTEGVPLGLLEYSKLKFVIKNLTREQTQFDIHFSVYGEWTQNIDYTDVSWLELEGAVAIKWPWPAPGNTLVFCAGMAGLRFSGSVRFPYSYGGPGSATVRQYDRYTPHEALYVLGTHPSIKMVRIPGPKCSVALIFDYPDAIEVLSDHVEMVREHSRSPAFGIPKGWFLNSLKHQILYTDGTAEDQYPLRLALTQGSEPLKYNKLYLQRSARKRLALADVLVSPGEMTTIIHGTSERWSSRQVLANVLTV